MQTKIKKAIALLSLFGILIANTTDVFAVKIGTGSITGSGTTFDINWSGNFNGTDNASGSITGIKVTANVEPILDMRLSADTINLGSITNSSSSGITIEVGTNSPS
jgi:hypothetical protein